MAQCTVIYSIAMMAHTCIGNERQTAPLTTSEYAGRLSVSRLMLLAQPARRVPAVVCYPKLYFIMPVLC